MNNVKVKYTGQKPCLKVQFPVPLTSLSEREGEPVEFRRGKPVDLTPEYAAQLLKSAPDVFMKVD